MILTPGITSVIKHVFLLDSAVITGAGKTALIHSDITAYYVRAGGTLTALTMETIATLGTWASSGDNYMGFKKLNDTNAPGVYELHLPNNILAAGVNQVTIQLRAAGIAPCNIEIQLASVPAQVKSQDNIDFGALQKASLNAATPASVQNISAQTGDSFGRLGAAGAGLTALGDARIANLDAAISTRSTLTAAQVLAGVVEGSISIKQALQAILAATAGESDGGGTATIHFRDQADTKNRITATVDANGNRTAITLSFD